MGGLRLQHCLAAWQPEVHQESKLLSFGIEAPLRGTVSWVLGIRPLEGGIAHGCGIGGRWPEAASGSQPKLKRSAWHSTAIPFVRLIGVPSGTGSSRMGFRCWEYATKQRL